MADSDNRYTPLTDVVRCRLTFILVLTRQMHLLELSNFGRSLRNKWRCPNDSIPVKGQNAGASIKINEKMVCRLRCCIERNWRF